MRKEGKKLKDKKDIIVGVKGKDGDYIREIMMGKGYRVNGMKRR